jgi:hypothetical protein
MAEERYVVVFFLMRESIQTVISENCKHIPSSGIFIMITM